MELLSELENDQNMLLASDVLLCGDSFPYDNTLILFYYRYGYDSYFLELLKELNKIRITFQFICIDHNL